MKILEDISDRYSGLVNEFIPQCIQYAGEIGYQIELFRLDLEDQGCELTNLRLREEGDSISESKYYVQKSLGKGEQIDDLFLLIPEKEIYFGYNLIKKRS